MPPPPLLGSLSPPLLLLFVQMLLVLCGVGRGSSARFAVYWNSSNHRLLTGDYTLTVHIDDYMDVYCPHSPDPEPGGSAAGPPTPPPTPVERPVLHMVDAVGFARCEHSRGSVRWRCGKPLPRATHGAHAAHGAHGTPLRFAEKFQLFTPFSLGFEFTPGQDYYYISTPLLKGDSRCYRLKVHVCCGPDEPRVAAAAASAVGTGAAAPRGGGAAAPGLLLLLALLVAAAPLASPLP